MIDVDQRSEVVSEISGCVVRDVDGKPRLLPTPGTGTHWATVLERHAGKGPLRITLARIHERRSSAQNRMLWATYRQILDELRKLALEVGERCPFRTDQELHEALKYLLLGTTVVKVAGADMEMPATTTKLSVEQFSAYFEGVLKWAAEHRIFVELQESA